ncbi:unnamed protein product [Miscanthus lutarioriparius]|uniref:Uncharacterized protein n=1 Tax=Miscanthus lutarioriparius TaxID=422564 RepID=A0A811QBK9_9POAL|nr:unnamed protein product [Miscanthus lutarioriparius]
MEAAIETIEYDVAEENYDEFIEVLRTVLAEYEPVGYRQSVVDFHHAPHPVLPRQRSPHRPARWIHVTLLVRNEGHATTLAIRDDNVYLIGFRNRRGQWYEFGFGGGRSARVLPVEWNSTFLECDVRYGGIVGGAMNLVGLGLGRWFARDAVRRLSAYEQAPAGGGVDERTRRHLARLIVMVCEAARMIPHFETVLDGWDRCTGAIAERQVHLLWNWKLMSHAVLRWDWWNKYRSGTRRYTYTYVSSHPPAWPPELLAPQVDVRNVGQALQVVQLLLNWSGPRALGSSQPPLPPHDTAADGDSGADDGDILRHWNDDSTIAHVLGQQGHCMLEMFGMRAGFYMCGTISVFDGMRGQIIYSKDDRPDEDDLGRRTMLGSLDHDDDGDSDTHQYGRHFGEWMFAHLRSIYDWTGLTGCWSRHSQTKTITSKRENGSMLGHDLVLTGPYRAISAYGGVSIEIDSSTTETDSNVELGISTTRDRLRQNRHLQERWPPP